MRAQRHHNGTTVRSAALTQRGGVPSTHEVPTGTDDIHERAGQGGMPWKTA